MTAVVRRRFSRRALLGLPQPQRPHARIEERCLAFQKVACESCAESCDAQAIRFARTGLVKQPFIDAEHCTACAACVDACPVGAIAVDRPEATS